MSGWTVPEFLDGMKAKLEASTELAALDAPAVNVFTAEPSISVSSSDMIVLGFEASDDDEPAALGNNTRDERQIISCYIQVMRPGAGEVVAKEARDRAADILHIVDEIVRTDPPAVGDTAYAMSIGRREFSQFPAEVGDSSTPVRACGVQFTINYRARTSV